MKVDGVDIDTVTIGKRPYWSVTVPQTVKLPCSQCQSLVECDVVRDDDIDDNAEACFGATIDYEMCEDCGKRLCPLCKRVPHPDDEGLVRCAECDEDAQVTRAEREYDRRIERTA